MIAFLRHGYRTLGQERVEALAQATVVVGVIGHTEAAFGAIAEHQMHLFRRFALRRGQQFRVMRELDHELGFGTMRQLGVGDFVAPRAEI